ncbi:MAG TPA: DUF2924 domain-containing protein [Humisphaera sp.]
MSTKSTDTDVRAEVEALGRMTPAQLRERHQELFGEPTRTGNRAYLVKRLAWRVQSLAEGGLSDRARRRAEELARDADLRTTLPKPPKVGAEQGPTVRVRLPAKAAGTGHDRLPGPGTVLTRTYRGTRVTVTVLKDGFEHDGERYRSLSAVARKVTGTQWNGYVFFGLKATKRKAGDR